MINSKHWTQNDCQNFLIPSLNTLFFFGFAEALRLYGNRLSDYEKTEIEKFSKIWYLGLSACKIPGEHGGSQNGGYDDDSGSYNKVRIIRCF